MLQINRHLERPLPMVHPVQVVDAAIRGANPFVGHGGGTTRSDERRSA
jgi:hypothetical protein